MKIQSINCPSCGGPIALQDGVDKLVCSYCGTTVSISADEDGDLVDDLEKLGGTGLKITIELTADELRQALGEEVSERESLVEQPISSDGPSEWAEDLSRARAYASKPT